MKQKIFATALLLTPLCFATPLRAENPEHVRQLLETKSCQECDLTGADLSGVDLSFAILVGANLTGANLTRANLSHADLSRANLSQTNFRLANLSQAYLTNANLDRTSLVGASLNGARGVPIMNPPIAMLSIPPTNRLARLPPAPLRLPYVSPAPPSLYTLPSRLLTPQRQVVPRLAPIPSSAAQAPRPIQRKRETATISQQPANIYPASLLRFFMNSCSKRGNVGGVNIEPICACSINKIQNEYTLDEFMSIVLDMAENKKPPQRFVQIATECTVDSLSR